MTAHERRTRYLRLLGDYQDRNRGSAPHLDELLGGELAEDGGPLWRETLQFLALDGLIRHYPSMAFSNDSAVLTDRGWQEVEELRRQAADPVLQRNVASNILLQWLYSKDAEGAAVVPLDDFFASPVAVVDGNPPEGAAVRAAVRRLLEQGLVKDVASVPYCVQITEIGRQCVDSGKGVKGFMSDQDRRPGHVFNINTNGGNIAVDAQHFTQNSTTYTGTASEDLSILLQAIAEALPVFGLSSEQTAETSRDLEVLEREAARPAPDQAFIKRRLLETIDTILGAGNQALGVVLLGVAKNWAQKVGLPE